MGHQSKPIRFVTMCWVICFLAILIPGCTYYSGPPSDHFDGSHFHGNTTDHAFTDHIKWLWEMETVEWPEWVDDPPQPPPVKHVKEGELRITYINHATVLIQIDGINILTDPIWSERAGPFSWLGAKRVRAPGVKMSDLPPIDMILISHDHYDHLDLPSLRQLTMAHQPVVLTGLGVKSRLASIEGQRVVELDWWQKHQHTDSIGITFVPALHESGRGLFDQNRTLWGGFVIESRAGRILFMGDSGYGEFIHEIKNRYSSFRLAVLPIGSYEKRWFMKNQHMNPDDAVRIHKELKVAQSVGMHFGTFAEHPEQSIIAHEEDLALALEKHDITRSAFWILKFGEGRMVSR